MGRISWDGVFVDHPVRPVGIRDPLAASTLRTAPADDRPGPRIGYAGLWEKVPERTWSGITWHLREGLRKATDTIDIGVEFPAVTRNALKALHARYWDGRLTSPWFYSGVTDAYVDRALSRGLKAGSRDGAVDAVLLTEFLATVLPVPFFAYEDCSWESLFSAVARPEMYADIMALPAASMMRRRDRQQAMYGRATGIITTSQWFARSLVKQSGMPADRVHVVHPGSSAARAVGRVPVQARPAPRRRLLFVGRQNTPYAFYRKGGDLVVAALAILRREYARDTTLTVVGLEEWPLPGPVPDGVTMLGPLPSAQVARLYDEHDLFVMPSRQESFGIVFAEAQVRGLPCVARNAYAMPEIITPGVSGALIDRDDPEELAATISRVLDDDALYLQCAARAPEMAAYFSWERTGRDVARLIGAEISG